MKFIRNSKSGDKKTWIKEVFANVVENMKADEQVYLKYFSKQYVQSVDGKSLNFADFVAHMKAQKKVMKSVKVRFKHILVDGDNVATVHIVDGIKKDGHRIQAQVNALFRIKNNKIILCDELTHVIKGQPSDQDLGSRK